MDPDEPDARSLPGRDRRVLHPGFWDGVKNSLIVVALTVVLSMVLAFLAAVALAKYRFTGRKMFVALVIGILMLPQVGLIIPLYVVLARYGLPTRRTRCRPARSPA